MMGLVRRLLCRQALWVVVMPPMEYEVSVVVGPFATREQATYHADQVGDGDVVEVERPA